MSKEQLLPCPFCGEADVKLFHFGLNQEARVTCNVCHSMSDIHSIAEYAIRAWNNRPSRKISGLHFEITAEMVEKNMYQWLIDNGWTPPPPPIEEQK